MTISKRYKLPYNFNNHDIPRSFRMITEGRKVLRVIPDTEMINKQFFTNAGWASCTDDFTMYMTYRNVSGDRMIIPQWAFRELGLTVDQVNDIVRVYNEQPNGADIKDIITLVRML